MALAPPTAAADASCHHPARERGAGEERKRPGGRRLRAAVLLAMVALAALLPLGAPTEAAPGKPPSPRVLCALRSGAPSAARLGRERHALRRPETHAAFPHEGAARSPPRPAYRDRAHATLWVARG